MLKHHKTANDKKRIDSFQPMRCLWDYKLMNAVRNLVLY